MRTVILLILMLLMAACTQTRREYPISALSPAQVKFTDGFWRDRFETTRTVTIPHLFRQLQKTRRLDNIRVAAGEMDGQYCTHYIFDDSDVYKSIEAAAYALMAGEDTALKSRVDSLIILLARMQEEDGYLYSPRSAPREDIMETIGERRWGNLRWSHELYCAGHMIEAAIAWYQATGEENFLQIARKNAGLILKDFGANALQIPPGHQEIELALVRLYQLTGDRDYFEQAKFFLEIRGRGAELSGRDSWGEYAQDHLPVLQQQEAVGHAVRAGYMYAAMTDMAALSGDDRYATAVKKLWENVVSKKLYITGGIGSTGAGEAFSKNYDLPNASAYNETCSSIALMNWNYRLYQLTGEGKYLDVMERTLYNAFLSGFGMEGDRFFYPNPLQSFGTQQRSPWFTCACCPPNVARFILSLPGKIYSLDDEAVYVNFYGSSTAEIRFRDQTLKLVQDAPYPWNGNIRLTIQPQNPTLKFKLKLRIPGWAQGQALTSDLYKFADSSSPIILKLNGESQPLHINNGFAELERIWQDNDLVELSLPMDIHRITAHDSVSADAGRVALQRGPIVYCAEWPEYEDGLVRNLFLPDKEKLNSEHDSTLLNGVTLVQGKALKYEYDKNEKLRRRAVIFTAIPYYAWAHRGPGEMSVWLANREETVSPAHAPTLISRSKITASSGKNIQAINDQLVPRQLPDEETPRFHWWPNKGTEEWLRIDFPALAEVSQVSVFWFDDSGRGECRVPARWQVYYDLNGKWQKVYSEQPYGVIKDTFNTVAFETVRTRALKILIQSQEKFAGGIYEVELK